MNKLYLCKMENELTLNYTATAARCDAQRELSLISLASDLIETATAHADKLGIGNSAMNGCGWVLARLTLEMDKFPSALSDYKITTWVESWNRHYSSRCFEISDSSGETLGYARSVWMVMDLLTHENRGLEHLSLPGNIISERVCPISRQGRHKALDNPEISYYKFEYSDIDYYRHVNTLRYIQVLLNLFSLEQFDAYRIARFELAFMHECYYGETAKIEMSASDNEADIVVETQRAQAIRAKLKFVKRNTFLGLTPR